MGKAHNSHPGARPVSQGCDLTGPKVWGQRGRGTTAGLLVQVPVADEGQMLVSQEYLRKYLVDFGNEKMEANWHRTQRFAALFTQKMLAPPSQLVCALAPAIATADSSGHLVAVRQHVLDTAC